jgi:hypothetical protein
MANIIANIFMRKYWQKSRKLKETSVLYAEEQISLRHNSVAQTIFVKFYI